MCKISMGNIRYLYRFDFEHTHRIAIELKAEINLYIFEPYCGNIYNNDSIKYVFQGIINDTNGSIQPSFPGKLSTWIENTQEIDKFIAEAYKESQDKNYPSVYPLGNPFRSRFYDCKNNLEEYIKNIISCCILDTSQLNFSDAIDYIKDNGYTHPTRQYFESHYNLNFTWNDFQQALCKRRAKPLPQGGSRPESDKIAATKKYCEKIVNSILEKDDNFIISETKFREMVKTSMTSDGQGSSFQITAAKDFFRKNELLKGHKPTRGRPRKNR